MSAWGDMPGPAVPIHGLNSWDLFTDIAAINQWIERANGDSEHENSMRVMKIGEEIGEVREDHLEVMLAALDVKYGRAIAAYIGMTGQNPRKGVTHSKSDLCLELADVAITALAALEHFTGSPVISKGYMASKIGSIITRADIPPYNPANDTAGRM